MEQELNNLKNQFDLYINDIKNSEIYINYITAKKQLEQCSEATAVLDNIKELTKAKHQCTNANEIVLVKKIEEDIENLHLKYDLIFEVVQFNYAYEQLVEVVNTIKYNIETQMN